VTGGSAPPLLALLLLAGWLGGVPVPLMLAVFAFGGWVAPARLTRAAVRGALAAPYVEAARAAGVGGARLLLVHLLPAALAPVAAWTAAGAATYVALEAGLDFLGLGLPAGTTSWGVALAGAQEAVAAGNWWWITFGGAALALSMLSLAAVARGVARALDPVAPVPLARRRVRQAYADRLGRAALVLIETLPGSAWDVTPPRAGARTMILDGYHLLVWTARGVQPALARVEREWYRRTRIQPYPLAARAGAGRRRAALTAPPA